MSTRSRLELTHLWLIVFALGAGAIGGRALAAIAGHAHVDRWTGSRFVATNNLIAGEAIGSGDLKRIVYVLHPSAPRLHDIVSGDDPKHPFGRVLVHPIAVGETLRHRHFRP